MIYAHEQSERRPNMSPLNTAWPKRNTAQADQILMDAYLTDRGLSPYLASANGWYLTFDAGDARARIVIPAVTTVPEHVYWQARAISPEVHIRYQSPKGPRKGAVVLVKPLGVYAKKIAVIVEGPMDALAAAGCGYYGFAIMGNNPPEEVLAHVVRLCNKSELLAGLVVPDADSSESGPMQAAYLACMGLPTSCINLAEWTIAKDLAGASVSEREQILASRGAIPRRRQ